MSEAAPEVDFGEVPKPRKKTAKKGKGRKAAAKPAAAQPAAEPFPGLTRTGCADGCNANGCVISGKAYCAHPTKGGLHASELSNADAVKRLQRARDQLQVRIDPDRFK